MREATITVWDVPLPQVRPKFRRFGSFVSTYDPRKKIKEKLEKDLVSEYGNIHFNTPVDILFKFFMKIPKMSKKRMDETVGTYHFKKPDTDNLEKMYLDCLVDSGIIADDGLVSVMTGIKIYALVPRIVINIKPLLGFDEGLRSEALLTEFQ